jgi:hypothetical protein
MRGSADTSGARDVKNRRALFRFEIVCQDQPLEMALESALDFSHSEMRAAREPFFSRRIGRIVPLPCLNSCPVAAFRDADSGSRNGLCFATARQAAEIIALETPHSPSVFPSFRQNPFWSNKCCQSCASASSEGDWCMKDTDHPIRHPLRHRRIFGRARNRGDYTQRSDQFGRGQNTGLGWSDPTFAHDSVPNVIRGVAPAQLRGDRAECFVRKAFHSRGPQ